MVDCLLLRLNVRCQTLKPPEAVLINSCIVTSFERWCALCATGTAFNYWVFVWPGLSDTSFPSILPMAVWTSTFDAGGMICHIGFCSFGPNKSLMAWSTCNQLASSIGLLHLSSRPTVVWFSGVSKSPSLKVILWSLLPVLELIEG